MLTIMQNFESLDTSKENKFFIEKLLSAVDQSELNNLFIKFLEHADNKGLERAILPLHEVTLDYESGHDNSVGTQKFGANWERILTINVVNGDTSVISLFSVV